jgi:hypothetical protein
MPSWCRQGKISISPLPLTFSRLMTYICRTAPLTSRRSILYIYSTNTGTEYFKHAAHSLFFSSSRCRLFHNATFFGSCIIHILNIGVLKFKRKFRHLKVKATSNLNNEGKSGILQLRYKTTTLETFRTDSTFYCNKSQRTNAVPSVSTLKQAGQE